MCITNHDVRGKDMSGLEWRFSVTSAMYVPCLPVEPIALLTAPQAQTVCYLNSAGEQRIRHNQLPSDAHFDEWAEVESIDYHFCCSVVIACMRFPRELCTEVGLCALRAFPFVRGCECMLVRVWSVCFKFPHIHNCLQLNNIYAACSSSFNCLASNASTPGELLAFSHSWLNSTVAHISSA